VHRRARSLLPVDDTEWIERARAGDPSAVRLLLEHRVDSLRRYFRRRVRCVADAEDLAQQTLEAVISALPRFRGDASFSRFVAAVARRVLLRHLRDSSRTRLALLRLQPPGVMAALDPSATAEAGEEAARLATVLQSLSQSAAAILRLHYWDGHTPGEIGVYLGLDPAAVRTRLYRARLEARCRLDALERGECRSEIPCDRSRARGADSPRGS
jgi:RNA polymerase sigma-70 factor (ECF subfamily)